ncbi:MAG: acylphosphatase [Pseudomonadota bacterium]
MGMTSRPTAIVAGPAEVGEPVVEGQDHVHGQRDVKIVARIRGRVQGVGYRYWTRVRAERLGLRGYVRNLTDGSVEALFMGELVNVARMLADCEEGPSKAQVDDVKTERPAAGAPVDLNRFRRAPTRNPGEPI